MTLDGVAEEFHAGQMLTQYYTATSIDGYIADPDNSLEWLFQFGEPEGMKDDYPNFIAGVGALAMGSTTYEWILDHANVLEDPSNWEYKLPTWVFSGRVLPKVEGADIRFVSGDVVPVHKEMVDAADGKNVWIVGGGELVGQFHDAGLLDQLILGVASVSLGAGAPLLPRKITTPPLKLTDVKQFGTAFVILTYDVQKAQEPTAEF